MLNGLRSAMGKLKSVEELFKGRHFDREIVILCVRWYLRFKLSLRDLVEMMASAACRWRIRHLLRRARARSDAQRYDQGPQRLRRAAHAQRREPLGRGGLLWR